MTSVKEEAQTHSQIQFQQLPPVAPPHYMQLSALYKLQQQYHQYHHSSPSLAPLDASHQSLHQLVSCSPLVGPRGVNSSLNSRNAATLNDFSNHQLNCNSTHSSSQQSAQQNKGDKSPQQQQQQQHSNKQQVQFSQHHSASAAHEPVEPLTLQLPRSYSFVRPLAEAADQDEHQQHQYQHQVALHHKKQQYHQMQLAEFPNHSNNTSSTLISSSCASTICDSISTPHTFHTASSCAGIELSPISGMQSMPIQSQFHFAPPLNESTADVEQAPASSIGQCNWNASTATTVDSSDTVESSASINLAPNEQRCLSNAASSTCNDGELIDGHHPEHWLVLAQQHQNELRQLQCKSKALCENFDRRFQADREAEHFQQMQLQQISAVKAAPMRRVHRLQQRRMQSHQSAAVSSAARNLPPRESLARESKSSARKRLAMDDDDRSSEQDEVDDVCDVDSLHDADADAEGADIDSTDRNDPLGLSLAHDADSDEFDPDLDGSLSRSNNRFSTLRRSSAASRSRHSKRPRKMSNYDAGGHSHAGLDSVDTSVVPHHRRSKLPIRAVEQLRHAFLELLPEPFLTDKGKAELQKQTQLSNKQISDWFTNTGKRSMKYFTNMLTKAGCNLIGQPRHTACICQGPIQHAWDDMFQ